MNDEEINDELLDTTVAPSKCTKHDVILGRGRRISNWPGNVHFRNVATKYRDEYSKANRYQKVEIALLLMDEIADMGGRFVRLAVVENDSVTDTPHVENQDNIFDHCYEVDEARAIEKTCQVLRDRLYTKPISFKKVTDKQFYTSTHSTLTQSATVDGNADVVVDSTNQPKSQVCETEKRQNRRSASNNNETATKHRRRNVLFSTDEMLQRLRDFQSRYNHTSVPPDWEHDVILADWCTIQRQLHRQHQSGYNIQLQQQQQQQQGVVDEDYKSQLTLFESLRTLNFCWDYDKWHWEYWYERSVTPQIGDAVPNKQSSWLQGQRKQYHEGMLSKDRSERLFDAGCNTLNKCR